MKELNINKTFDQNICDYNTFKQVLDTFKIPEKYKSQTIAKAIYDEYKLPDKNLMN